MLSIRRKLQRLALQRGDCHLACQEDGLTLIETLVAIVVIALTLGAITPALVIAVATRVQSQRAEQALAVAQGEIDQVRLIVEQGGYEDTDLPQSVPSLNDSTPATMVPPDQEDPLDSTTAYDSLPPTKTRAVDVDGDGDPDFGIQVYRTGGVSIGNKPVAFGLGVRVYDIQALDSTSTNTLEADPSRLGITGGEGERGRRPLAALYTSVVRGEDTESYCEYFDLISSPGDSTPQGCT
ncbi:uncharacterized protein XM38_012680 [Halomicronema hongdechloris C2206]|uniref:Type II secretion system protein n=2 Tax=Halomicronema hongdechloris TaxID=1209493 RepID=A0A1Z3HJ54_9CYAN|nr:uncharacterized protein XM38_012680 [Halomicronema hongdechloris C2206]